MSCFGASSKQQSLKANLTLAAETGNIGDALGNLVSKANDALASSIATGRKPVAWDSLRKQLDSDTEVLVNPRVSKVISETNRLVKNLPPADYVCARDWAQLCPDGWKLVGSVCAAPSSYTGSCQHAVPLTGATVKAKYKFASDCQAPWPCADECARGRDYDQCPKGWVASEDAFCENPEGPTEQCGSKFRFQDMTVEEKEQLALICQVEWPCSSSCLQDFEVSCPEGWDEVSKDAGFCVAPVTYAGSCSVGVNTTGMTMAQRKAFAVRCSAPFPCVGSRASSKRGDKADHAADSLDDGNGPLEYGTGRVVQPPKTMAAPTGDGVRGPITDRGEIEIQP
jgi:CPW-WPC domain-containing protein